MRREHGAGRRAAGALEAAILGVLWNAPGPLSPGEVREVLAQNGATRDPNPNSGVDAGATGATDSDGDGSALSYSTVVTILTRLHEKGSLSRERDGRAYRYAPVSDEAGLAARRLSQLLDRSADREAVLSRFVADLSAGDEVLLRSLLGDGEPEADSPQAESGDGGSGAASLEATSGDGESGAESGGAESGDGLSRAASHEAEPGGGKSGITSGGAESGDRVSRAASLEAEPGGGESQADSSEAESGHGQSGADNPAAESSDGGSAADSSEGELGDGASRVVGGGAGTDAGTDACAEAGARSEGTSR